MLISTVVAVALGLTPTQPTGAAQFVTGDYSAQVGRYSQYVDGGGRTHIKGHDRLGVSYELVMDKHGHVEASVGEEVITFQVQQAD